MVAEVVGDLKVNIGADSANFTEEVAVVNKGLEGLGLSAEKTDALVQKMAARQSAALKGLIESIDPTTAAMNKLDAQYAALVEHSDAGRLSGAQFEHFNGILNETRDRLLGVKRAGEPLPTELSAQALAAKKAGISIGQYNMAMRTLPMQMTDIVTQLAGGQNPLLILIQQGGQVKDVFGGFKPMLAGLRSAISPTTLLVAALAAGTVALGAAYYQGAKEESELNKQLILTGNYAGETAGQLEMLAKSLSGHGTTQHDAAAVLAQVVGSGKFTSDQLALVTKSAIAMQQSTGQAIDKTIANFDRLNNSPTQASETLNNTLHYLTSSQYAYIASLERRGDKELAGQYATELYGKSQQDVANKVVDSMGLIERAAKSGKDYLRAFWDAALDVGRDKTAAEKLADMKSQLVEMEQNEKGGVWGRFKNNSTLIDKTALQQQIKQLEFITQSQEGYAEAQKKAKDADDKRTESLAYQNKVMKESATWQQKRYLALKELWAQVAKAPDAWTKAQRQLAVAGIDKKFKPPKTATTKTSAGDRLQDPIDAETRSLQVQLKVLKEHAGVNDIISSQREKLWQMEAKFTILEEAAQHRALTKSEQSLLVTKDKALAQQKINAELGDQVAKQKRLNQLSEQADKYIAQQTEKVAALADAQSKSSREAQRALQRSQLLAGQKDNPRLPEMLDKQQATFDAEDQMRTNWLAGAERSWADYADSASDAYGSIENVSTAALNGLTGQMTDFLTTGESNFKEFTVSILKMLTEIIVKMEMVRGVNWFADAVGWGHGPSKAAVQRNARGGVYTSASLSAYSGSVVSRPTLFAFAKGAGLMGEAGPEAILPLRRGANGKLGVVASTQASMGEFKQTNNFTLNTSPDAQGRLDANSVKQIVEVIDGRIQYWYGQQQRDGGALAR